MKLPQALFRIAFPAIYLRLTILFIGGVIATIAEGPNPLSYFFYPPSPGVLLLKLILPVDQLLLPALEIINGVSRRSGDGH